MASRIGLLCLIWAACTMAQCGSDSRYASSRMYVDEMPSVEERVVSFEEVSNEYYPQNQDRYLRSSRYSTSYSYGNDLQPDSGDWERYVTRRPVRHEASKSRRKYGTYGRSSRTRDYKDYRSPLDVPLEEYGRKKTNRATRTHPEEGVRYGKTTEVTFKAVAPKAKCAQNLLIGCTPTVTRVPCSSSLPYEPYGPTPYYHQPPVYHHAPPPLPHYAPSHPPAYAGGYPPHPASFYYPPSPPAPRPTTYGASSKPAAASFGPSYKAAPEEEEHVPGFAAPVQENLGETSKAPIISAFSKPSPDTTVGPPSTTTTATVTASVAVNGTNGTEKPASAADPMHMLTETTDANEDDDKFWGMESNTESSTDATEVSTAR